ncbi:heterokaryon incompatibility protein s [Colletotrichum spaethianum]|uniref:Heterokaryon incompatibility protein s n=1 Tax=Colletotrichum spaethianum TaxID=700344 RepID=A0AA37P271_9PEZI|nr:heterokaryon incompatibility protein s [Colletotrichum spaethianum]GKT45968.1 heterokaryon incompatibility protein s [Colletotrichum spaethianum]
MAAETFGVVAGALSIASLFNNCVDCFEYIQMGRHFGRDFERSLLRIDIAKARLSRWGEAVAINENPCFTTNTPGDRSSLQVQSILEQINDLFQTLQRSSKHYEIGANHEDLVRLTDTGMQPVAQQLHRRLSLIAGQRQKKTSLTKKVTWALYDGKNFNKLVNEMMDFVDALETLFPAEQARRRLARLEIDAVEDEESLTMLQDAAQEADSVLSEAVREKFEGMTGRNYAEVISAEEQAKIRVGNEWSEAALDPATRYTDRTENGAGSVAARGTTAVHIGNRYGGRGIFD